MESTNQPVCSETFFRKLWNESYSHVKIPKVRLCPAVLSFQNLGHSPTKFPVQNPFVLFYTIGTIPFSYYNAFKSSVVFSFSSLSFFYLFILSFLIFKSIHLPVQENRFSKCDTCCNLKEELRGTTNPTMKAALEDRRKNHIAWVRQESDFSSYQQLSNQRVLHQTLIGTFHDCFIFLQLPEIFFPVFFLIQIWKR